MLTSLYKRVISNKDLAISHDLDFFPGAPLDSPLNSLEANYTYTSIRLKKVLGNTWGVGFWRGLVDAGWVAASLFWRWMWVGVGA